MDEAVMRAALLLAVAVSLAAAGAAHAGPLRDPTRPPAQLYLARGVAPGAAASAAPQLQSVLIGRQAGGRHIAVIDGETVRLGDNFRGARVVRMTQTEVELMRGRERQVLKLAGADAAPASFAVGKQLK
jgi:MSHA biogenesis protein MshK